MRKSAFLTVLVELSVVFFIPLLASCRNSGTDIWSAIDVDDFNKVKQYCDSGGDLECGANSVRGTPLRYAIENNKRQSFVILLEAGASPNTICRAGAAPMYSAVVKDDIFWVQEALRYGGDPNLVWEDASSIGWQTPLTVAINCGNLEFVKLLIANGADVELKDPRSLNAVSLAARWAKYEVVFYLLTIGADYRSPSLEDSNFITSVACHVLAKQDGFPMQELDESFDKTVSWLNEKGIFPEKIFQNK